MSWKLALHRNERLQTLQMVRSRANENKKDVVSVIMSQLCFILTLIPLHLERPPTQIKVEERTRTETIKRWISLGKNIQDWRKLKHKLCYALLVNTSFVCIVLQYESERWWMAMMTLRHIQSLETNGLHFYYMQIKGWITRTEKSVTLFSRSNSRFRFVLGFRLNVNDLKVSWLYLWMLLWIVAN